MIGFHYTSLSNYKKIQKQGMKPYLIDKPELNCHFKEKVRGIWIWCDEQVGVSEFGTLIFQLSTKCDLTIVKLEIDYDEEHLLVPENKMKDINITHYGAVGQWQYHQGEERAVISVKPIDKDKIKLLKTFDLLEILERNKNASKIKTDTAFRIQVCNAIKEWYRSVVRRAHQIGSSCRLRERYIS